VPKPALRSVTLSKTEAAPVPKPAWACPQNHPDLKSISTVLLFFFIIVVQYGSIVSIDLRSFWTIWA
jgi:hypothetical protein